MGTTDKTTSTGDAQSAGAAYLNTAPRSAVTVDFADLASWVQNHLISEPVTLENGDTLYFVGGPSGVSEFVVNALNPKAPDHITGAEVFNEPESVVTYLQAFDTGTTLVIADLAGRKFVAQIDYHDRNGPHLNRHHATLVTPYDDDYAAWKAVIGKEIPQAEFGNWFEDMLHTVYRPNGDEEAGGAAGMVDPSDLLDMLNSIQIQRDVAVKSIVNSRDGTIKMRYEEEDAADILLPREVLLQMPVFAGTPEINLLAKLRYRVAQGGAVFFKWAIPGLPNIERGEFRKIGHDISERANVPVLYGQTGSR